MKVGFDTLNTSNDNDTTLEVATTDQNTDLAPATAVDNGGGLIGELDTADVIVPSLKLGQKVGKLTEDNPEWTGHFILDDHIDLGSECEVVVAVAVKSYLEDLPFDSPDMPKRWSTSEEAIRSGRDYIEAATITLAVKQAEEDEATAFVADGEPWALARYYAQKTSYIVFRQALKYWRGKFLNRNFRNGSFKLKAIKVVGAKNTYYKPDLSPCKATSEEFRKELELSL